MVFRLKKKKNPYFVTLNVGYFYLVSACFGPEYVLGLMWDYRLFQDSKTGFSLINSLIG
jgi:hypothetical protein